MISKRRGKPSNNRLAPDQVTKAGPRGENGKVHVIPGNECQLRIMSLLEPLSELILSKIVVNLPQGLRLKWSTFKELRLSEENEWDDEATFEELAAIVAAVILYPYNIWMVRRGSAP